MTNEEAIKELNDLASSEISEYGEENCQETLEALDMAREALRERKTGKWIHKPYDGGYYCSICGRGGWIYSVTPQQWKACPWCTTLMEVDE